MTENTEEEREAAQVGLPINTRNTQYNWPLGANGPVWLAEPTCQYQFVNLSKERIIKRIKQQFDYQKRNMNDRFNNLGTFLAHLLAELPTNMIFLCPRELILSATLEEFKNQVAQKYEIDFTDDWINLFIDMSHNLSHKSI